MKRPSGTTVVTAVLGAFVIFGVVSNYLTKRSETRQISRYSSAGAGLGHLLNGKAWKAGFTRGADEPTPAFIPASLPVVVSPPAAIKVPISVAREPEAAPAAEDFTKAQPIEPEDTPRAQEPKTQSEPPPQGRMGLAGPAVQHHQAKAPAEAPPDPHHTVQLPARPMPPLQPQSEEFGPSIFKRMDTLGLN